MQSIAAARQVKVAVIGGGCGAMSAAFELSRPEHQGRFAVTVYQEGWRLGGKGASGRGASGRIEEHGLHVWLGFYDNAFRMMRECYAELAASGQPSPFGHWQEAFVPESDIGLFSSTEQGGWQSWAGRFPPRPGLPGDLLKPGEMLSLSGYIERAIELLRTLLLECDVTLRGRSAATYRAAPKLWPPDPAILTKPEAMLRAVQGLADRGVLSGAFVLAEALGLLGLTLSWLPSAFDSAWVRLAERVGTDLRRWLEDNFLANDQLRHVWEIMDLMLAILVGTVRFDLLTDPRGLDAIEDYECREWLRLSGASERALQSPFVRGLYDLALAYEEGDSRRPSLAAGQALRGALRMFFGYRGALYWRMRAGMGDVVFAPLYEALRRRGVRFQFFHRLTNVGLPPGGDLEPGSRTHVSSLSFDVQAEVRGGQEYAPLFDVAGRPCWPSMPNYEQLVDGARLAAEGYDFESHWDRRCTSSKILEVSRDFDFVVLGVSVGAIPHVCSEIIARDARWRRMVAEVKTVASQAFQIWLDEDLEQLGWLGPPYIVSAFAKPFDSWCDMAHVIPEEDWRRPPRTTVYFCGALQDEPIAPAQDDAGYPSRRAEEVRLSAVAFLANTAGPLWPGAYNPDGGFRWEILADATGVAATPWTAGPERFETQHWRANVNPSDRYVLNPPGSSRHRISPLDMTYDNFTVAGDWTNSGFNQGCVEAAIMSGRLAAHALAGTPALEDIVGYDHP